MTTIALVDDENSIRTSVSIALESEGFKVDVLNNGVEALEALETKHYDLGSVSYTHLTLPTNREV